MRRSRLLVAALYPLLCVGVVLAPQRASASGFFTGRFASEQGHPATDNASALFYNPAALVWGPKVSLLIEGDLAVRDMRYNRATSDTEPLPDGAEDANTGSAHLRNVIAGPSLFGALKIGDYVVLGAGLYVPFGGAASWGRRPQYQNTPFVGAVDGPQRWHGIEGQLTAIYGTGGAAVKLGDTGVSLGVTASLVRYDTQLTQALTAVLDDNPSTEGRMLLDVGTWTGAFGLGVGWEALPGQLWLGASYQAPPGLYKAVSAKGDLTQNFVTGTHTDPVRVVQRFPDQLRAGLRYLVTPQVELRLSGEFLRWSVVKGQCVGLASDTCAFDSQGLIADNGGGFANFVRRWHNTGGVRVGGSYFVRPDIETYAGVGYDGNAVPDSTLEPNLFDGHDITGTAGLRLAAFGPVWVNASYTHMHALARNNVGKSQLANFPGRNHLPSSNGTYKQWIGIASLILEVRLD